MPSERILTELGRRLRRARLDANLTQRALAKGVGVSLKTVCNAEDGHNISLGTLIRLLRGVGALATLEPLLADQGPSPIALAERGGRIRQRASGARRGGRAWRW